MIMLNFITKEIAHAQIFISFICAIYMQRRRQFSQQNVSTHNSALTFMEFSDSSKRIYNTKTSLLFFSISNQQKVRVT